MTPLLVLLSLLISVSRVQCELSVQELERRLLVLTLQSEHQYKLLIISKKLQVQYMQKLHLLEILPHNFE